MAAETPDEGAPPWAPALADWTLQHELLSQIRDRLGHVAALLADLPIGVKQRHTPPPDFPRPHTALDAALAEAKAAREKAYDDKLMAFADKAKARWRENEARRLAEESA